MVESSGLISTLIFSLTATPWASEVVSNATLSVILKIGRSLLNGVRDTITEPVVLIKSELVKNNVSSATNVPVRTFTLTVFWSVVVSNTSPVATGAATPSDRDNVAPFVYEEFLSKISDSTSVVEENTSPELKDPVMLLKASLFEVNTFPTISPVAPVPDWMIVSPSNKYASLTSSM